MRAGWWRYWEGKLLRGGGFEDWVGVCGEKGEWEEGGKGVGLGGGGGTGGGFFMGYFKP